MRRDDYQTHEFLGFRSGVAGSCVYLGCDAVLMGARIPIFLKNLQCH